MYFTTIGAFGNGRKHSAADIIRPIEPQEMNVLNLPRRYSLRDESIRPPMSGSLIASHTFSTMRMPANTSESIPIYCV